MTWLSLYGLIPPPQGPAARAMNGLDLSWPAGMLSAGLLYYALYGLGPVACGEAPCREAVEPSRAGGTGA